MDILVFGLLEKGIDDLFKPAESAAADFVKEQGKDNRAHHQGQSQEKKIPRLLFTADQFHPDHNAPLPPSTRLYFIQHKSGF
jgi:hypothetical protein